MDLDSLNIFLNIAETRNMTVSSKQLFKSQPNISRQMKQLEGELGFPLFIRNRGVRSIELTQQGEEFLLYAKRIRTIMQEAGHLADSKQYYYLNVAALYSINTYVLDPVYRNILQSRRDLRLSIHNFYSLEAYNQVSRGAIDLSFTAITMHHNSVRTEPCFEEKTFIVANKNTVYANTETVENLPIERCVYVSWSLEHDSWFIHHFGNNQNCFVNLLSLTVMEELLRTIDCWALVPASMIPSLLRNEEIVMVPIKDRIPDRRVYMITPADSDLTLVKYFVKEVDEHLKEFEDIRSLIDPEIIK